jgi:hypothetical protein
LTKLREPPCEWSKGGASKSPDKGDLQLRRVKNKRRYL